MEAQSYLDFPSYPFRGVLSHGFSERIFRTPGHHSPVGTFFFVYAAGSLKENDDERTGPFLKEKTSAEPVSRRNLIRGAAGAALGAGLFCPESAHADDDEDKRDARCNNVKPIPGGVAPFKPFGTFVHHNPLNPLTPLANISDPSQITDFDGFVGLTNIRGGGTGTDTTTGVTTPLAFRADMGFSKGKFIGTDGRRHQGTFAFV